MATTKETGTTDEKLEIFCDPCRVEDEHIIAVSYCEECNEYMCKHCHKAHSRLAVSRDHVVKEQNDLPDKHLSEDSKVNTPEKCIAHGDQGIDHFCISHEELCCQVCLTKRHKNCKDVVNIVDYLADVDMQKEENDLKCKMRGLADDLKNTTYLVQTSLKAIEHNYDTAQSNMLKAKTDVFDHIEVIYDTLNKQLCKTREEDLDMIMQYKDKCDAVAFDMKTLDSYFNAKKPSNKTQMFLALKSAGVKIKSNRHELREITYNKHLNVKRYRFDPNSGIIDMKTKPSSFGTMKVLENAIKAASFVTNLQTVDTDDTNVGCITGISVLSGSILVIADHKNASVKLVNTEQDRILSKVKFESAPWDVTVISDNQIAVTVPDNKSIEFLSVSENTKLETLPAKQIKLEGKCYGITNFGDMIIVIVNTGEQTAKLEQYGSDGKLLSSVTADVKNPQYVISNAERTKIYISDNIRDGRIIERSSHDFMKLDSLNSCKDEVTGMAIDRTGVLYYCDSYYHVIDSVYLNEKHCTERRPVNLITGIDPFPKCLAFCNVTNRLFVGKDGNDIEVYIVL